MARKILIVVDMQNDFIDGALGTKEAVAIVSSVIEKIKSYPKEDVFATRDTHPKNYMVTQEGKYLPVPHCIKGTDGWQIRSDIADLIDEDNVIDKPTFGSVKLAEKISELAAAENIEIEFVKISVDPSCCAGVTPEKHEAALETMRSCQIQGI